MRTVLAGLALVVAASACSASLDGSSVTLLSPLCPLDSETTYTFAFRVTNGSYSGENIQTITIVLPPGLGVPDLETMGYAEIVSGRPEFEMIAVGTRCTWDDSDINRAFT